MVRPVKTLKIESVTHILFVANAILLQAATNSTQDSRPSDNRRGHRIDPAVVS